jgi:dihydrofolate synthase / folylpolyglutamate synthase
MATSPFSSLGEALAWLDAHIDYESAMPSRRALPTLDRMRELVAVMGDPQVSIPAIHVTGTNGKGSTAAMATALIGAKGLTVGTYTSPNLSFVNERISRNGEPIDDESFTEVLGALATLEAMLQERPTRFELLTAAALRWFSDEAVDSMVIEVGVGGSWDCTNVVDAEVAVITNVSFDHTEILGPSLEGIAWDKSGIIKPASRVVVGSNDPQLVEIVRARADEVGAGEVWILGEEFDCTANRLAVGGRLVDLRTPEGLYPEILVPLHGPHQGINAVTALAAVEAFFGAPLDEDVVELGFASVSIPGRFEILGRHPLVIIDGAHNVAGVEALHRALDEGFAVEGKKVAVVGMLTGRDPSAMLRPLMDSGIRDFVVCAPNSPRALDPSVIAEAANALGNTVRVIPDVADAVREALAGLGDDDLLVVAGSLYVVASAREVLASSLPHTS